MQLNQLETEVKSMYFIIQKEHDNIDIDTTVLESIISSEPGKTDVYENMSLVLLKRISGNSFDNHEIPVGDLRFVQEFLKKVHNVDKMNPIEVPEVLRTESALKRKYSIVKGKDLPDKGNYFVKGVSQLKLFTYQGDISRLIAHREDSEPKKFYDGFIDATLRIHDEDLYILSELVDIKAEYRCFVNNGEIEGVQFYSGKPTITLTRDMMKEVNSWTHIYSLTDDAPKSYAMDVAVIEKDGKEQVAIIEVCPVTSVGLYGFNSSILPKMYKDGIDWYINVNKPLVKDKK